MATFFSFLRTGRGNDGVHSGTNPPEPACMALPSILVALSPNTLCATFATSSIPVNAVPILAKFLPAQYPNVLPAWLISLSRTRWIYSPTLILIGHEVEHNPSPAHRSRPILGKSFSKLFSNFFASRFFASLPDLASSANLAISRCTTMRWRLDNEYPQATQFTSQKPHSIQRSIISCTSGNGLICSI